MNAFLCNLCISQSTQEGGGPTTMRSRAARIGD
uniref:Uncharacterized protein n=1 Tax=Nymphaea colorata TaxID=210225 RepID=A0A5K0WME6_9MAGN